jgi:hypothetical protein
MAKRKAISQSVNLTFHHKKSGIALNYLGNLLMKATTFLKPHFNRRFAQEVKSVQSEGSPNFKNFMTVNLGVPREITFGSSPHVK